MKKSILIASVVALAMGAQAQVDEWVNPFEKWDAYYYVQQESDGEFGKWFLKGGKYPTLVEYDDSTRIGFKEEISIVFDLNDFNFPQEIKNRYLNIKFHLIHNNESDGRFANQYIMVRQYKEDENPFGNSFEFEYGNTASGYYNHSYKELHGLNYFYNETFRVTHYWGDNDFRTHDYRYVRITIGNRDGGATIYLSHIKITGTNGGLNADLREYNNFKYFYEPFFFKDLEGYQKPEITTSINNNNVESNIYVSNNVLHTDEPSSVYIFNASGILVKTENSTTSVDLSDLKKGVYIAKVNGAPIRFVR